MATRPLPPLNWLRSFEAAARHLSFTAAAEELHITQSAVSQQVKLLEQFLGEPLFLRRPRSLQLTDAARHYLPSVTTAFTLIADGTKAFFGPLQETALEIKSNTAFSVFWLMPRIGDFLAAYPWVRVNLSTALWTTDFAGSSASVEIRYGRGEWEGDTGERLTEERLYPVCAPALAERIETPEDLADEMPIHVSQLSDSWDYWADSLGLADLRGRDGHYLNTFVLSLEMARRGLGVALGHDAVCRDLIARGALAAPLDLTVPARDNYYLLLPDRGSATEAARAFRDWMLAQVT